jgi:hypothetical protein
MLESNMNRVERLLHYTATPPEAPLVLAKGQRWDARHRQLVGTGTSLAQCCVCVMVCVC